MKIWPTCFVLSKKDYDERRITMTKQEWLAMLSMKELYDDLVVRISYDNNNPLCYGINNMKYIDSIFDYIPNDRITQDDVIVSFGV